MDPYIQSTYNTSFLKNDSFSSPHSIAAIVISRAFFSRQAAVEVAMRQNFDRKCYGLYRNAFVYTPESHTSVIWSLSLFTDRPSYMYIFIAEMVEEKSNQ